MSGDRHDSASPASRRADERVDVTWAVDCKSDDTFLYAYITNVSSMGVFVRTDRPLGVGTRVHLAFSPDGGRSFQLDGEVAWINPLREEGGDTRERRNLNPGMGVRLLHLRAEDRERLVDAIRTIAYVRGDAN